MGNTNNSSSDDMSDNESFDANWDSLLFHHVETGEEKARKDKIKKEEEIKRKQKEENDMLKKERLIEIKVKHAKKKNKNKKHDARKKRAKEIMERDNEEYNDMYYYDYDNMYV